MTIICIQGMSSYMNVCGKNTSLQVLKTVLCRMQAILVLRHSVSLLVVARTFTCYPEQVIVEGESWIMYYVFQ